MRKDYIGTVDFEASERFQHFSSGICKTLKAETHDICAVEVIKLTERVDTVNESNTIAKQASKQASKQVEVIGCMNSDFESTSRVYSTDGVSPTVCTYCGGNQEAKILEVKKLDKDITVIGSMQENAFIGNGDYCHSLTEAMGMGGGQIPIIVEKSIVAMRGRNPDNPSDRTAGLPTEQRLEPNEDGVCNTLTSVQKDNLVLETTKYEYGRQADIERLVNAVKDGEQHLCKLNKMPDGKLANLDDGEVCDIDSPLASTVTARYYNGIGAHKDNMVMKSIKIRQATKDGFIDCEVGGVVDLDYPDSQTRRGRVIENGQICPTLTTENIPSVIELGNHDFYNFLYEIDGEIYLIRIRKLIPKECWRLMDFTDEDFEKAEAVNSSTQLYKQAGNSLVRCVMAAIMSQLNIGNITPWNEMSDAERSDTE